MALSSPSEEKTDPAVTKPAPKTPTPGKEASSSQEDAPEKQSNGQEKDPLESLQAALVEKENRYKYLYAEFENYKKRAVKERSEFIKFGWEPLARELLGVIDNLERALNCADPKKTDPVFMKGLQMVQEQFVQTLSQAGVQVIATQDKDFNPELHEATEMVESDLKEGKIVSEQTRGYTLHGRLIRPARVAVSKGKKK